MASTDEKCLVPGSGDEQDSPVSGSYGERRRQAHEVLSLQRSHLDRLENEFSEQLQRAIEEIDKSAREIEERNAENSPAGCDVEQLQKLEAERDSLLERLTSAEAMLREQGTASDLDAREADDLRCRFETAVDEVRELKRANAELEQRLKSGGGSHPVPAGSNGMDWEAQKQRLLASLEADEDGDDEEAAEQRASIEGTIRITDQIVAQKDEELAELKRLLGEQASPAADERANSGATHAIEEILNSDEIIRQERERLAQVQAEWREKIGQAEIDVSVERAKIARERTVLEEKVRQFEAEQQRRAPSRDADDTEKPARGRWLARLGLMDNDETQ